ncbi:unnamed protein product [Protopolystoma xenopodis]|uniref:Uncharacterized protein n=1 Tax=Protopolystoma xenopodis TaxID=117903 RepID=A0A448WQK6_9PLAT|nr:unnamed protein product [Protopolystoma xenopodis]
MDQSEASSPGLHTGSAQMPDQHNRCKASLASRWPRSQLQTRAFACLLYPHLSHTLSLSLSRCSRSLLTLRPSYSPTRPSARQLVNPSASRTAEQPNSRPARLPNGSAALVRATGSSGYRFALILNLFGKCSICLQLPSSHFGTKAPTTWKLSEAVMTADREADRVGFAWIHVIHEPEYRQTHLDPL